MKNDNKTKLIKTNLGSLIEKYQDSNALFELEREYLKFPAKNMPITEIYDSGFLKGIPISKHKTQAYIESHQRNMFLEPLVVRAKGAGFEVVIGRNKLAAAKLIGLASLPVIIGNYTDEETLLILLTVARDERNENKLELAFIFNELNKKFEYSHETLGQLAYISRPQVTNMIRLLNLPKDVFSAISNGKLTYGHARVFVSIPSDEISSLLALTIEHKLTVRKVELISKKMKSGVSIAVNEPLLLRDGKKITLIFPTSEDADIFYKTYRKK